MKNSYDVVIIGSGPAGLTAAIYAARANLSVCVLAGSKPGGQLMITTDVEDFPSYKNIQGPELMEKMIDHAKSFGVEFITEDVITVDFKKKPFKLNTDEKTYEAKSVIIATGASAKWLGIDSEKKLIGKGVSACATCVVPETEIITNPSMKQITKIENDKVLTHEGRFKKCYTKGSRLYNGELVLIDPHYLPGTLKLTPEHEVLAAKRIKSYFYKKFKYKKLYKNLWHLYMKKDGITPNWIPAGELTKGDFLFYPILKEVQDLNSINISDIIKCKVENGLAVTNYITHTSHKIKNNITLNEDFMRLCGYYVSEGNGGKEAKFSFNKDEFLYAEDAKNLIKKFFNFDAKIEKVDNVLAVMVYSGLIGNFFKTLFGDDATTKFLPSWMLYISRKKQIELIRGMWRGDGSKLARSFHYTTSSKALASQLQTILLRLYIIPSIVITTKESMNKRLHKIDGRLIIAKQDKYEFKIHGQYLKKFAGILNEDHKLLNKESRFSDFGWFSDGYFITPIRHIKRE